MVGAATRRKRRVKQNATAAAVEQSLANRAAERKALGTAVGAGVPNAKLFSLDRSGQSKKPSSSSSPAVASDAPTTRSQFLEARRLARQNPPPRRSEQAAHPDLSDGMPDKHYRRRKRPVAVVESRILSSRVFDPPEGHVGNRSKAIRESSLHHDGREDLWSSDIAADVANTLTNSRKQLVAKVSEKIRSAPAVVVPAAGMSVNPSHAHHQDKLGEALAAIIAKRDEVHWNEKKMSYDPALLHETTDGHFGDTGMNTDVAMPSIHSDQPVPTTAPEEDSTQDIVPNSIPERKTRQQRNKEARKRELRSNIRKKRRENKTKASFEDLPSITEQADAEADKKNGVLKQRHREMQEKLPKASDQVVIKKIAGLHARKESMLEPVILSEEFGDTMRGLKMPVMNPILRDRYLSFERRGIVEPMGVVPKEMRRMELERRQDERKDKRKRRGKHSKSNISYWKEKSRKN